MSPSAKYKWFNFRHATLQMHPMLMRDREMQAGAPYVLSTFHTLQRKNHRTFFIAPSNFNFFPFEKLNAIHFE